MPGKVEWRTLNLDFKHTAQAKTKTIKRVIEKHKCLVEFPTLHITDRFIF